MEQRIGEEVIIDPAEAAMVTDEWKPNEFIHYGVNLNKRTCGCGHWQHYGIACNHAIVVWEKYQEQLAERNGERMEADAYIKARAKFALRKSRISACHGSVPVSNLQI